MFMLTKMNVWLILSLVFFMSPLSYAQQEEQEQTPPIYEQVDAVFGQLDQSELNTGLLIERAIGVGTFNQQDGLLANLTLADINMFGQIYADLSAAAIQPNYELPDPQQSYMSLARDHQEGQSIPFALLSYEYQQLKESAMDDNLLTYTNGKFYDVPNRPSSPYETKDVFIASPLVHRTANTSVVFDFNSTQFFNNFSDPFTQISINFGDGNGYQNISIGQSKNIQYTSSGKQDILSTKITN